MNVHFIAIGGSAMHNLAIALHRKGYRVTGSDDEIFEPSKSRLLSEGILPQEMGWDATRITDDLDAVILGMHAREDNPELLEAKRKGITIYSYPEYLYQQSIDKKRIVVTGSHGKTTITAMLLHILNKLSFDFDFMVGAHLEGFDNMVKLSDAPIIVLEGDEYLSSPIDRRPKFIHYKPDIAILSGIAWDHINVFPTEAEYIAQFEHLFEIIEQAGSLIYNAEDTLVNTLVGKHHASHVHCVSYVKPTYEYRGHETIVEYNSVEFPMHIFGAHNMQNMMAAVGAVQQLGVSIPEALEALADFKGASNRLETIAKKDETTVIKDFAHSPSKLKATIQAVKERFSEATVVACMELHTFSSLNALFLKEYGHSMDHADIAAVYFDAHTIAHKKLPPLSTADVKNAFKREDIHVITQAEDFSEFLFKQERNQTVFLLMSSGNFGGLDINKAAQRLTQ